MAFILVSAFLLILFLNYKLTDKYFSFSFISILIAYQLGQYSERKFKK